MARRLAAFQVMDDYGFRLKKGDPAKEFKMKLTAVDGAHALLAYKVWTDGKPVTYSIRVPNYKGRDTYFGVYGSTVSHRKPAALWEVFPADLVRRYDHVLFTVTGGKGRVYFSDVVLWCMRN